MTKMPVSWTSEKTAAVEEQRSLRNKLIVDDVDLSTIRQVLAIGVAYSERKSRAYACAIPMRVDGHVSDRSHVYRSSIQVDFPYVPGLFAYREGPAVSTLLESLPGIPDLLVFHAQGIAHPRGIGLAAHLGLLYERPSIGLTRKRLFGKYQPLEPDAITTEPLRDSKGSEIGLVARLLPGCDPIFASPGHKADVASLGRYLKGVSKLRGCMPEGLCLAQEEANKFSRRG